MKVHMQGLRSLEDSERVRKACIRYLQNWYPCFYPDSTDIIAEMQSLAIEMGGRLETPSLPWRYAWIKSMFGWKAAKTTQDTIGEARASVFKHWDKAMFDLERRVSPR
jgi:hypothetical protein